MADSELVQIRRQEFRAAESELRIELQPIRGARNHGSERSLKLWRLVRRARLPLITRAQDAIKAGATRDTLAMQVKTEDLGWMFNAGFYGSLYDELTKK